MLGQMAWAQNSPPFCPQEQKILKTAAAGKIPRQFYQDRFLPEGMQTQGGRVTGLCEAGDGAAPVVSVVLAPGDRERATDRQAANCAAAADTSDTGPTHARSLCW